MGEYLCWEIDCGYGSQPNSIRITSVRVLNQKAVMGGKQQNISGLTTFFLGTNNDLVIAGLSSRPGRTDRYLFMNIP